MLQNYLKTAMRSLLRHRFFSGINVFGLAVAMSICMGIMMLVADQVSYDRFNTNANRIYRVNTIDVDDQGLVIDRQENAASTMKLRQELEEKYTGIEKIVRIKRGFGNSWMEFEGQDVNIPLAGFFADPEVLELFQYELQYGDATTALKEPYSVVLTRKAANKLFKEENPVGQTVKMSKTRVYMVTGVLKETENKSHIVFEGLASMSTVKNLYENEADYREEMDNWTNFWNGWTYILLEEGKSEADIQQNLDKIYKEHIASIKNPGVYKAKFVLQSILDITPGPMTNNQIGPGLPWIFVYFLGGLALVILLTSCFNFTNLSIARSLTRAREIGVRKVTGAARWQIFIQFLSESIVVALVALVIAMGLMFIIKPMILQLNFSRIFRWDLQANYIVYGIFVVFAILVGILAGIFPAAVLSGFQPVKVLKSLNNMKLFSRMGLRKVLLVSQFTLSLFFILTVIVMYNQLKLFMNQEHGFNMEKNISVKLNSTKPETLKNELLKYNNIIAVSGASHVPAAGTSNSNGFKKSLDEKDWINFGQFTVDEDYLKNMDLKLLAGRFFAAGDADKKHIVINEAGVKKMFYENPLDAIGEEVLFQHDSTKRTIIGVVADYNHRDLTREIGPMALNYSADNVNILQIRYAGNYQDATKTLEKAWAIVNPGLKIDYKKVDSEIKQFYEIVFGDIVKILGFISSLAILISCLGLLGMATYATETRIKEISIRKVLGSSSGALVLLLSKGFLSMLGWAVLIGAPAAYFINNLWLQLIVYHTNIDIVVVLIGVGVLILFGVITIGSQTIRATFVKPVDNLKSE
jgi:putative ABC transport system permease protein